MAKTTSHKKSVWVVDDDPVARLLINKTLERTGLFEASREFEDGSDLIKALKELTENSIEEPDLILLDINMPEKDGWDVLTFIKDENIPFIRCQLVLLTSSINPKDKARAFSYDSVDEYLNKPLAKEDLQSLNL